MCAPVAHRLRIDLPCGVADGLPELMSIICRLELKPCSGWPAPNQALYSAPGETPAPESLEFGVPLSGLCRPASMNQGKIWPTVCPAVAAGCSAEPSAEVGTNATRRLEGSENWEKSGSEPFRSG